MASIVFNPTTGKLDYVGGSTSIPVYELVINNNTQWGVASGGIYTLTILAATHGNGIKPLVQCFETNGPNYSLVILSHKINNNGDVIIEVDEVPDNRFLGKILIKGQ